MKLGGGRNCLRGRVPVLHFSLRSCQRAKLRCLGSDSSACDHILFIKDVAATKPPAHLNYLLKMLQIKGESVISPGSRQGFIPIVVPLTRNNSGAVTALLRWPTAPLGLEMPVVEVRKHGIWILAKDVDHYIHRILVEEDVNSSLKSKPELFEVSTGFGKNFYKKGDFAKSQISNIDDYLLRKVGLFPDVLERKVMHYYEKGDHISALVTADFYTKKEHFPGIGRPFVFNAEVLLKFGRGLEAKDAARGALKSPWWTLGCQYQEVAGVAQWDDEPIENIKKMMSKEKMQEDLSNGKSPEQIAIDEAAFLLDLASVEGNWDQYTEQIVECYEKAGLHDIARFVSYKE
uniref:Uncharacterized protein n=2 Tax=Kalanchoe fedtschenkoi TaxID=63787 RepID=A0A7N0V872_KALFE